MSFSSSSKGMKDAGAPAFLEKLFDMLEDRDNFEYIAWQPTGDAFLIKKVNELQEIVLPKFFKHNNLQSFVRQLNMYSFSKTCHDPNYREFRNPHFIRGRRDLLHIIKRKAQSSLRDSLDVQTQDVGYPAKSSTASRPSRDSSSISSNETQGPRLRHPLPSNETQGPQKRTRSGISKEYSYAQSVAPAALPELSEDFENVDDLQLRVRQLETKTWILSERYHELVTQHESLCNTLQMVFNKNLTAIEGSLYAASAALNIPIPPLSPLSEEHQRVVIERVADVVRSQQGQELTRMISTDSCPGVPSSRGLLNLVDAATFSVDAGKPIFRQRTIDNTFGSNNRAKASFEGQMLCRMSTI